MPTPAEPGRKEVIFTYPDWLNEMTARNAAVKPLAADTMRKTLKEVEESGDADPFRKAKETKRAVNEMEEGELNDGDVPSTKRRKDSNIMDLNQSIRPKDLGAIGNAATESSKEGAGRRKLTDPDLAKLSSNTENRSPFVSEKSPEVAATSSNTDVYKPLPLPPWYTKITTTSLGMKELNKTRDPRKADSMTALSSMKTCIKKCEQATKKELTTLFEELRNHVHKAEVLLYVDKFLVRKAMMLDANYGLPPIFASSKVDFPWDLKADAWQLYNRWYAQIFELDLLRGIQARRGTDRNADRIDPLWPGRVKANYYGEGSLVLGQWWPTQLCAVRDGAHGAAQGGIFGEKGKGAYSVVLSGGGGLYDDEDKGTEIWYSGTDGKDSTPSENTLRLMETCNTVHNQVRVLRSHQLHKSNPYRPVVGLRYDGLYDVAEMKHVDAAKASYKFRLVRSKGQHPIRCEDNAARRPTIYEINEDEKLRKSGR